LYQRNCVHTTQQAVPLTGH